MALSTLNFEPLENYANNFSPLEAESASDLREWRREHRYALRQLLWAESGLERVRKCGRVRHSESVAVRVRDGVAGFAGVTSCGSIWADPVCNAKVMARRAVEVGTAVALWQGTGGQVVFTTLTMRHHRGHGLAQLWDALSAAWNRVTGGKAWLADKARHGVVGYLRVVEVTYGKNGWHVHVHALLFVRPGCVVNVLHASMFGRWQRALERRGLSALTVGQDARLITGPADADLAAYFTKATADPTALGLEFTQTQSKTARSALSTQTPWHFLDDVLIGDADALDRWHEWEKGSRGRRQMTWSKGMRDLLGIGAQASDEEVAAEEMGTADDNLVRITAEGWEALCSNAILLPRVLVAAERGGLPGLRMFLDSHSISYVY